jgi:hypothetical protein
MHEVMEFLNILRTYLIVNIFLQEVKKKHFPSKIQTLLKLGYGLDLLSKHFDEKLFPQKIEL